MKTTTETTTVTPRQVSLEEYAFLVARVMLWYKFGYAFGLVGGIVSVGLWVYLRHLNPHFLLYIATIMFAVAYGTDHAGRVLDVRLQEYDKRQRTQTTEIKATEEQPAARTIPTNKGALKMRQPKIVHAGSMNFVFTNNMIEAMRTMYVARKSTRMQHIARDPLGWTGGQWQTAVEVLFEAGYIDSHKRYTARGEKWLMEDE